MDRCDYCGIDTEHAFQCNYCQQSVCGEHRLPKNHGCPVYTPDSGTETFSGGGPQTKDRPSTHRKRTERVREGDSSKRESRAPAAKQPQSKGDYREASNTDVLSCPTCGKQAEEIANCEDCGQMVCPSCRSRYEHECPTAVTGNNSGSEQSSLLQRVRQYLGL